MKPESSVGRSPQTPDRKGADPLDDRLLVVDDTAGIHDDFRKILVPEELAEYDRTHEALFGTGLGLPKRKRFQIDSAFQGREALELVTQAMKSGRPYRLAFVDIRMPPGWDGIETTRQLWRVDPHLQIVICSAHSDYSWEDMAFKLRGTDNLVFLKKPFEATEILQLGYTLTAKSHLAEESRSRIEQLDTLVAVRTRELRTLNGDLVADIAMRKEVEARLIILSSLGRSLSEARTERAVAEIILEVADRLIGWDACGCQLYSPEKDAFTHLLAKVTIAGAKQDYSREAESGSELELARKAIKDGGQLVVAEAAAGRPANQAAPNRSTVTASVCVPIRNGHQAIGVLVIHSHRAGAYDQRSLETLQTLADHCAGALDRIQSEEMLHQTEQQLRHAQKMEAVGLLAGGVAHDFNNLLAVILGNAEMALDPGPPSAGFEVNCLNEIISAATKASGLTRQLLTFSRKQLIAPEPLNLNDIISNLSNLFRRVIGQDIRVELTCADDLPLVNADAGLLDQVVMNLVVNARDAMPQGGDLKISTLPVEFRAVDCRSHPDARPGRFVRFTVGDTGTGIAPELLTRIFEPFFTTKARGKGTGLGLSTVFGIVKQHAGWLEVESTVGVGTTFQVFLPALPPKHVAVAAKADGVVVSGGSERILLVEDEAGIRRVTGRFLAEAGYGVIEAASGQEALDLWSQPGTHVDLLLTDVLMPGGTSGWDLAKRLAQAKPELKVVFMSGYAGDIPEGALTNPNGAKRRLLQKPCSRDNLLRVIRESLDEHTAAAGVRP